MISNQAHMPGGHASDMKAAQQSGTLLRALRVLQKRGVSARKTYHQRLDNKKAQHTATILTAHALRASSFEYYFMFVM